MSGDPSSNSGTLVSKETELMRLRQKRRGLEIDLELLDRRIRKLDVDIHDLRATMGILPED